MIIRSDGSSIPYSTSVWKLSGVVFHSGMKTIKILLVYQVWALLSEHWRRADQIAALVGRWDSCSHIWGVLDVLLERTAECGRCPNSSPHHCTNWYHPKETIRTTFCSDPWSFPCLNVLSLSDEAVSCQQEQMSSASLGLKWPCRVVRTQPLRLSAGWTPCTSCGTPHRDLQNWILGARPVRALT